MRADWDVFRSMQGRCIEVSELVYLHGNNLPSPLVRVRKPFPLNQSQGVSDEVRAVLSAIQLKRNEATRPYKEPRDTRYYQS